MRALLHWIRMTVVYGALASLLVWLIVWVAGRSFHPQLNLARSDTGETWIAIHHTGIRFASFDTQVRPAADPSTVQQPPHDEFRARRLSLPVFVTAVGGYAELVTGGLFTTSREHTIRLVTLVELSIALAILAGPVWALRIRVIPAAVEVVSAVRRNVKASRVFGTLRAGLMALCIVLGLAFAYCWRQCQNPGEDRMTGALLRQVGMRPAVGGGFQYRDKENRRHVNLLRFTRDYVLFVRQDLRKEPPNKREAGIWLVEFEQSRSAYYWRQHGFRFRGRRRVRTVQGLHPVQTALRVRPAPIALGLLAWPMFCFYAGPWARAGRKLKGLCIECGYDARYTVEPRCPECGADLAESAPPRASRQPATVSAH